MNKNVRPTKDGFLPLVIGVAGHRDLRDEDVPELEKVVSQIIEKFKTSLPHTPILLLSALAEGADFLVARVALERGVRLIVPLPMRRELYRTDFTTDVSAHAFDELLLQATHWFELPLLEGSTEEQIAKDGAARNRQYEQAGAYIVRHSHLLIALWDGAYRDSVGGTSQIVHFQLQGVPEPYTPVSSPIDTPESGPVYHVVTPRISSPEVNEPFTLRRIFPRGYEGEVDRFERICERIDKFNQDVLQQAKLLSQVKKPEDRLLLSSELEGRPLSLQLISERFDVADTLANYFRKLTGKTLIQLFISVLFVAITLGLYSDLFQEYHWILALYLGLLAIAYLVLHRRAKKGDYQNKHQDYRALAEGMRIQFYWCLAGSKLEVADHYLRKQRSELDWICGAIRVWSISRKQDKPAVDGNSDWRRSCELVLRHWVEGQAGFYLAAAARNEKDFKKFQPYVKALLLIGVAVALLFALSVLVPHWWHGQLVDWIDESKKWHGFFLVLMTLPPIGAALLHNYVEKKAFSENAKRYGRMSVIFSNARDHMIELIKTGPHQQALDLIEELGREALGENADWVLLHRERPLEVPHA